MAVGKFPKFLSSLKNGEIATHVLSHWSNVVALNDTRRSPLSVCVCVFSIVSHVSPWISPHYYVCTCPVQHLHMLSRGDFLSSMSAHAQCRSFPH